MKRLSLFLLVFTATESSLTVAASDFVPSHHFNPSEQGMPTQRTSGKRLAPELITNAGYAAIKVLAAYIKQQVTDLTRATTTTKDYQSALLVYNELHTLYLLIKAQQDGAFLIERLRVETQYVLNDQFFAEYERAVTSLKNR